MDDWGQGEARAERAVLVVAGLHEEACCGSLGRWVFWFALLMDGDRAELLRPVLAGSMAWTQPGLEGKQSIVCHCIAPVLREWTRARPSRMGNGNAGVSAGMPPSTD
jgi:hypothetical protein